MFRMYANNSHSYTNLIVVLGIVRKPTVRGLLFQNILEYTTLACLILHLRDEAWFCFDDALLDLVRAPGGVRKPFTLR